METNAAARIRTICDATAQWWQGQNDRPLIAYTRDSSTNYHPGKGLPDFFPTPDAEPRFEEMMDAWDSGTRRRINFGAELPVLHHSWGARGTPMVDAAFLGGTVSFTPASVWVEPICSRIDDLRVSIDPDNRWFIQAQRLFRAQMSHAGPTMFAGMPDFGDALTVLSLLRGVQPLLIDTMENPAAVHAFREQFVDVWKRYHAAFWDVYRQKLPGDMSWLVWAPGRTYAAQCDFSTMISPEMFMEFVVPEIKAIGTYLDYMIWHLDGSEEIQHLDALLACDEIKAIQWVPGAGKPSAASPRWCEMLKRIQARGKSLYVYADNPEEAKILMHDLSPRGLYIRLGSGFESTDPDVAARYFGDEADFGWYQLGEESRSEKRAGSRCSMTMSE